jgi:hypothetical protein
MAKRTRPAPDQAASTPSVHLLSGGNPQIAKADGHAPVLAYIAAMPDWKRTVGERIDAVIADELPDVERAVKWNSPLWGCPGKGWFLGLHCFKAYVKLAFFNGSALKPQPPVAAADPGTRYLHLHSPTELDDVQFRDWIRQASSLPGWHSSKPKSKS